jgi:hypothetical protein
MADRFDFEQQIMKCWNITDDLGELSEGILDQNLDTDQITNSLNGLQQMYGLKFEKLWNHFETVYMADILKIKMLEEECAALRQQLADKEKGKKK